MLYNATFQPDLCLFIGSEVHSETFMSADIHRQPSCLSIARRVGHLSVTLITHANMSAVCNANSIENRPCGLDEVEW